MSESGIYSKDAAPSDGGVTEKAAEAVVNVAPTLSAEGDIVIPDYDAPVPTTSAASSEGGGEPGTYTIDEAIETVGFGKYQIAVLLMGGLCWTADAMEMLLLSYIKHPLQCEWGISDMQAASITTGVGFGMLCGSITWGIVADTYGRRLGFLAVAAFTFLFGLLSAVSTGYGMMVISRSLVGFGIGGVPVAFSLMMEFLPMAQRGTWGMGIVLFWSGGAIFESLVAMNVMPTLGWRWLIAISSFPLGLLLFMWPVLPESPRWLVGQGRLEEAEKVLAQAARINGVSLPPGKLSKVFEEVEDGHGAPGLSQIEPLIHPVLRPITFRIWYLWFACAFVYYGLVMVQPDMISMENKGLRCDYHVEGGAAAAAAVDSSYAVATISGDVAGTVKFRANADGGVAVQVSLHYPDATAGQTDSHKWHVHTDALAVPASSGAECSAAGGHYDPTFQEHDEQGNDRSYRCLRLGGNEVLMPEKCYAGDMSGKLGTLEISGNPDRMWDSPVDPTITIAQLLGRSVVIHGPDEVGTRIGCGNIVDGNAAVAAAEGACAGAMTQADYMDSLISTCGEFPGIILTVLLIDILGRRPLLAYMFGICACAFVLIVPCIGRAAETAVFFVARGASNGFFQGVCKSQ